MLSSIITSVIKTVFSAETKGELLSQAKDLGITGRWAMRKPELARAIRDAGGRVEENI